jgi:hypothetical protein
MVRFQIWVALSNTGPSEARMIASRLQFAWGVPAMSWFR